TATPQPCRGPYRRSPGRARGPRPPLGQPDRGQHEERAAECEPRAEFGMLVLQHDRVGQVEQRVAQRLGVLRLEVLAAGHAGDLGQGVLVEALSAPPAAATATEA